MKLGKMLCCLGFGLLCTWARAELPSGFVFVQDAVPGVVLDIRYAGTDNFTGSQVEGYEAPQALLSTEAAVALGAVSDDLRKKGYGLKIFDAYRPEQAVRHFVRWARDAGDIRTKARFYPDVDKSRLFIEGYIAERSGHSRGSTVDLTLIDLKSGQELDMGSPFDLFGTISHHGASGVEPTQAANRALLAEAMEAHGFRRLNAEWWHYTLKDEPFSKTYFDFPITRPTPATPAVQQMLEKSAGSKAILVTDAAGTNGKRNKAVLRAYVRENGVWVQRFSTDGWLGKNGLSDDKHEQDGTTPTGTFSFGRAFGNADDPGARLSYTKVSAHDVWVDDPASTFYNQWMRDDVPNTDWKSAERLASYAQQYEYAASINYNTAPVVPGKGSAIFLHVATDRPTAGCVSVPRAAMKFLLRFIGEDTLIILKRES